MSGVNKAILIGNLGKDPEVRTLSNGDRIVSFSIATSETWRDKASGERKERTEWHNIVIFNDGIGKIAEQYLKKGSKVYVEGQIQTRKWEKDGATHYTTEIVLQRFRGELQLLSGTNGGQDSGGDRGRDDDSGGRRPAQQEPGGGRNPPDDDIPF